MKSVKILHTGDLHLGSAVLNMGSRAADRRKEMNETFSRIIRLAKSEKADFLLIAGDLFDNGNPDAGLMDFVCGEFEKISETKIFIVLGNHDYDLKCAFPPNVYVFNDFIEKISVDGTDIYGVSFAQEHCSMPIAEGLSADSDDSINIFLVHGDVGVKSLYNPISEDMIMHSKMDYIALGHVHSHRGFNTAGSTTYAYCGIPEGRAFDECGIKGVIIAEVEKGHVNCRFVPVCSREYECIECDISGLGDNFEIAQKVLSAITSDENACRIILKGEKNTFVDCDFIKDFLEKEVYFTEVIDNSVEVSDDGYTLKNLFMEKCDNENALRYGLSALRGEKVSID